MIRPPLRLIASLLAVVSLCQCDDKGAAIKIKGLRDEIDQLSHQNYEAEQQRKRLENQIDTAKVDKKRLEDEKAKVEAERAAAEKRLDELKKEYERYKVQYKLSMVKRAPGLHIEDFTTSEGKSYRNVVLKEINEKQINFTHESGIMKVDAKLLPEKLQALLGYLTIIPTEEPRQVAVMTPRQVNAKRRTEYELTIQAQEAKLNNLRKQRDKITGSIQRVKLDIDAARGNGTGQISLLEKQLADLELAHSQTVSEILKEEVELHQIRSTKVELLPER